MCARARAVRRRLGYQTRAELVQTQQSSHKPIGCSSRLAGGAVWCRGAQLSCGLAAARRRGAKQCNRSRFVPAYRRCRFLADFWLIQLVDKVALELLPLDCAAESALRGRDAMRRRRGYGSGPFPGCLGQAQNLMIS